MAFGALYYIQWLTFLYILDAVRLVRIFSSKQDIIVLVQIHALPTRSMFQ